MSDKKKFTLNPDGSSMEVGSLNEETPVAVEKKEDQKPTEKAAVQEAQEENSKKKFSLSPDGSTKEVEEATDEKPAAKKEKPKAKTKTIAVGGSQERIGTTTQALQLCQYLNSVGVRVCYVEKNDTGYVRDVREWYRCKEKSGFAYYGGIAMHQGLNFDHEDYDCLVIDYGARFDRDDFESNDLLILVCGTGAGELTKTSKLLNNDYDKNNAWYLFNLVPENEDKEISGQMGNRVIFSSYTPDPFILGANEFKELKLVRQTRKKGLFAKKDNDA